MSILADKLELWGVEKDLLVFTDGSMGFSFNICPLDISCWHDDEINGLNSSLRSFLNSIPENVDFQFVQIIQGGKNKAIEEFKDLLTKSSDDLSLFVGEKRVQKFSLLDENGMLPNQQLSLFIRVPLSKDLIKKGSPFSKASKFVDLSEIAFSQELKKVERVRSDLEMGLKSAGIQTNLMSVQNCLETVYELWNPGRMDALGSFNTEDIRDSLVFTDSVIGSRGFSLGEYKHRVISLKLLPGQTFSSMSHILSDLPFDSKMYLTVHVPDQQKELAVLQTQRRISFSMVQGKTSGPSDIDSQAKFEDLESLLEKMIAEGEKVFHFALNVVLRSKDSDELEDQVAQTLQTIRELGGSEGMLETLASFDIFSQVCLPNSRVKERTKRIKSSNLANLIPIYGQWEGHQRATMLLRSRSASIVKFDPFSPALTNANMIISGGSGAGKSFLANLLLLQCLKDNPQIYVIDIGGSYKKICSNLNGQYIPLGLDQGISINPFDLIEGEKKPTSEKIKYLLSLVDLMTKEDNEKSLKKFEKSEVEKLITLVYEQQETPRLSHLKDLLINHEDKELKRLGQVLSQWCGGSPYGRFLDQETTISLNKSMICFDLKKLESHPDLQSVCLLMITDKVNREAQLDKTRQKYLVFDECWALLEGEGASFIGSVFRTFRKYFGSCIAISQTVDDFAKSKVSEAIMANCSTKWILRQKGADKNRLRDVLDLNDTELELITSLSQVKGKYSEAFLMSEDQRAVVIVESTPIEYWLATTDPRDLGKIEEGINDLKGFELLKRLSEKYPRGYAIETTKGQE